MQYFAAPNAPQADRMSDCGRSGRVARSRDRARQRPIRRRPAIRRPALRFEPWLDEFSERELLDASVLDVVRTGVEFDADRDELVHVEPLEFDHAHDRYRDGLHELDVAGHVRQFATGDRLRRSAGSADWVRSAGARHVPGPRDPQGLATGRSGAVKGRLAPVTIDARAAIRVQIGGVERLAREMALRLPAMRPDRYRVLSPRRGLAHRAGHLWEQAVLPAQARGSALLYCPANLAPVTDRRNVVVIHDAAALRLPKAYSRTYVAYQRRMLPLIARRARLVITVSEFARTELVELLGIAPDRVKVIPAGVDERFRPTVDPAPARRAFGLERPYALALGTRSARKNIAGLEAAARALRERGIEPVLAGGERGYLRDSDTSLRSLGYVSEPHLPALYAGARVLAVPSLHEGFGLPCLEAMASGVPVVAARRGALPETVGDAGLLVDPESAGELADALVAAACDQGLRARLIAAGLRRAAAYPWRRTAVLTDRAMGKLLEESG